MKPASVIFLNGTSSSGKTTLARALQEKLTEPYMYVSIDDYFHMYPDWFLHPTDQEGVKALERHTPAVVSGLHRSVAALAETGNNVIVDHLLQDAGSLEECVENWAGFDVLFVGIKCPLKVAEEREKTRGNRRIGTARYQYELVHAHALYDIEVDTSKLSIDECVISIMEMVRNKPPESAFQELARRYRLNAQSALRISKVDNTKHN